LWRLIQGTIVTVYVFLKTIHPSAGALPSCALLPFAVFLCEEHERPHTLHPLMQYLHSFFTQCIMKITALSTQTKSFFVIFLFKKNLYNI